MASEFEDLRDQIAEAADHISRFSGPDEVEETPEGGVAFEVQPALIEPEVARVIARGLHASMLLAEASQGECQEATPYSPLRAVRKKGSNELLWCCNHTPPHCVSC